ncbi:MAG: hypothetical protein OEM59_11395, partial [Rhodospirillales bacterium]|nr:hypothetical protein [Rhodospirillales bacterium]
RDLDVGADPVKFDQGFTWLPHTGEHGSEAAKKSLTPAQAGHASRGLSRPAGSAMMSRETQRSN